MILTSENEDVADSYTNHEGSDSSKLYYNHHTYRGCSYFYLIQNVFLRKTACTEDQMCCSCLIGVCWISQPLFLEREYLSSQLLIFPTSSLIHGEPYTLERRIHKIIFHLWSNSEMLLASPKCESEIQKTYAKISYQTRMCFRSDSNSRLGWPCTEGQWMLSFKEKLLSGLSFSQDCSEAYRKFIYFINLLIDLLKLVLLNHNSIFIQHLYSNCCVCVCCPSVRNSVKLDTSNDSRIST